MMEIVTFADMRPNFVSRIQKAVYCSMATIDRRDRPRSRIMHLIWEFGTGHPLGWAISSPTAHKSKHLSRNPHVSLAYIHDETRPVYVDCTAEWIDTIEEQRRVWELHKRTPAPLGFDPEPHYGSIDHPHFGILRFRPWRIELGDLYGKPIIWRS